MQDIYTRLSTIRRPRLLVAAARHGLLDYSRTRHLKRVLYTGTVPTPGAASMRLMEIESAHNNARLEGCATYSVARHVDVLIALMAEARLLRVRCP